MSAKNTFTNKAIRRAEREENRVRQEAKRVAHAEMVRLFTTPQEEQNEEETNTED
jgi:hypothetical protein